MFICLIHFEIDFYVLQEGFFIDTQLAQSLLLVISQQLCIPTLSNINYLHIRGSVLRLFILLHWSIHLSSSQHLTILI